MINNKDLFDFMALAMTNAILVYTISYSKILQPFRDFFFYRSVESKFMNFLHELISCHFCLSYWTSIPIFFLYKVNNLPVPINNIVSYFCFIAITNLFITYIFKI